VSTEAHRLECTLKFSCDRDVRLIGLSLPERVSDEDKVLFDWENDDEFYVEQESTPRTTSSSRRKSGASASSGIKFYPR
jgi:hypothetical protein